MFQYAVFSKLTLSVRARVDKMNLMASERALYAVMQTHVSRSPRLGRSVDRQAYVAVVINSSLFFNSSAKSAVIMSDQV